MTTAVKDIVCFLASTADAATVTLQALKRIDCNADRTIFFETPKFNQPNNGYALSFHDHYISVSLSVSTSQSDEATEILKRVILNVFFELNIDQFLIWYDTANAFAWSDHLYPAVTIYYCSDLQMKDSNGYQTNLLKKSDLIITEGLSAFEFLHTRYENVSMLAPIVAIDHFFDARYYKKDPVDQAMIPHPRVGHFGCIDSVDVGLVKTLATQRPGWQFIFLCEEEHFPALSTFNNVHFLGNKTSTLTDYVQGWDVGFLPYGPEDVRRFLNPPQLLQFLAAEKPVVCTMMPDVMRRFGKQGLIQYAGTPAEFIIKIQDMIQTRDRSTWKVMVNEFLNMKLIDTSADKIKTHLQGLYKSKGRVNHLALKALG
jgi:hypothetical protein